MPPSLLQVVINRSEAANMGTSTSKLLQPAPIKKGRTYDDKPLPIQASEYAPRNATIVSRNFEGGVVTFELKIGETVLSEVGLDEVLDYVSAHHLEEYENNAFKEEEELLKIVEEESRRLKEEQVARRNERARTKGTVAMEEVSSDEVEDATEFERTTGKHGRARPSYKPLFKQFKQRRQRRKRDPKTGELIPFSDDDQQMVLEQQDSSSDDQMEGKMESEPVSLDNLPKRRRRKRDPITSELLPLEPIAYAQTKAASSRSVTVDSPLQPIIPDSIEKQKRPRRRRHPITNELMPLGWRYDPEEEQRSKPSGITVMQRLSLTNESEPKRRRLDPSASSNERSRSPTTATQLRSSQKSSVAPLSALKKGEVIDLGGTDSESSAEESIEVKPSAPKPKLLRRGVGGASATQNLAKSQSSSKSPKRSHPTTLPVRASPRKPNLTCMESASSNSSTIPLQVDAVDSSSAEEPEEEEIVAVRKPAQTVTSIVHPSAAADESSSEEEELDEDEYVVEHILGHALSNPDTHPSHLGKQPVMLYKVKWEGWPEPTWEPETSFGDLDVVRDYQRRKGLDESGLPA